MPNSPNFSSSPLLTLRHGDLAEYLAQFMLSSLGASILIPRQEDHGFDFHCTLNAAPSGELPEFKDSFYLQTKLGEPKEIEVGGRTKGRNWRRGSIHRLLNMDLPILMGFVDIERYELTVYQTSARWLLYYELVTKKHPFQVVLRPSTSISAPMNRKASKIKPTREHDGRRWMVDLGPPLFRLRLSHLKNPKKVASIKATLTAYLAMERTNAAHRIFCSQWASWICKIKWQGRPFRKAWVMEPDKFPRNESGFYHEFGMSLVSLLFRLHLRGSRKALREASALFRAVEPRLTIPKVIRLRLNTVLI